MIVIDVGCARYGGDFSIERLLEEFCPDKLYGFDPNVDGLQEALAQGRELQEKCGTEIWIEGKAVWIHDGFVGFEGQGLGGRTCEECGSRAVPCIDLARFITELDQNDIILKIDAEGAEYTLLEHLIETRTDALLKLAWVEWHPVGAAVNSQPDERRAKIEKEIACELTEWRW
jgi:FkbM family methyltransferase